MKTARKSHFSSLGKTFLLVTEEEEQGGGLGANPTLDWSGTPSLRTTNVRSLFFLGMTINGFNSLWLATDEWENTPFALCVPCDFFTLCGSKYSKEKENIPSSLFFLILQSAGM